MSGSTLPTGVGLTDPTLAFNLTSLSDWSTEMPFLDITHNMRQWIGHNSASWSAMSYSDLRAGGYLDSDGWLTHMPAGLDSVGTIWDWSGDRSTAATSRAGTYVLSYEGEGTIQLTGNAQVISSEPGRIVFENTSGSVMGFNITATDPHGTGNYLHDISVVPEKYEALAATGELFNPDWLSLVQDARELRFMGWMDTNNSTMTNWADRSQPGDATWSSEGAPVEVMVALANQTGSDPWFTMPATASDDYIRQFATYVRDHLDPGLTAHVEYSNETWNWSFSQASWLQQQAQATWGEGSNLDYVAMRATQTALIWDQVFGAQADARVDNVLGTQNGNPWALDTILRASVWASHDPTHFVAPGSVFDSVAITTYFGYSVVATSGVRDALLAAIRDPGTDASAWLTANLKDPSFGSSIPQTAQQWADMKAVADQYGLGITAYEGGQHVQQAFALSGISDADLATLTSFLTDYVRSPDMAQLYQQLWDAWAQISDGPFMQFGDVETPSKYGSWGLLSDLGDTNPRAELLHQLNATEPSWFGDGGGTQLPAGGHPPGRRWRRDPHRNPEDRLPRRRGGRRHLRLRHRP